MVRSVVLSCPREIELGHDDGRGGTLGFGSGDIIYAEVCIYDCIVMYSTRGWQSWNCSVTDRWKWRS